MPHATTNEDSYRGFNVPRGITVIANTYAVHHDPNTYPEPEKFVPARFLPTDHPLYAKGIATLSKHYAFGVGRRACPGLQVANSSLYIVISRILWGFDITVAPSGPPKLETRKFSSLYPGVLRRLIFSGFSAVSAGGCAGAF